MGTVHSFVQCTYIYWQSSFLHFYEQDEDKANMQKEWTTWPMKDLNNSQKEKLLLWDWRRKLQASCSLGSPVRTQDSFNLAHLRIQPLTLYVNVTFWVTCKVTVGVTSEHCKVPACTTWVAELVREANCTRKMIQLFHYIMFQFSLFCISKTGV